MKAENTLLKLGYTPNEVKVYLASLKLGEATIAELSHEVEMPRSTLKELVVEMHKHGLLNYYVKKGHKVWFAENPDHLLSNFKEKEEELMGIIPFLKSMTVDTEGVPKIRIFSGREIKLIMEDILETKHHINAIVSWDDWIAILGHDYIYDFIDRRAKHNLKIRLLTPRTQTASGLKVKDTDQLRQTRFLPSSISFGTSNFFYGNKSAIIALNKKNPVGVLIEDPDVAKTMEIFFECLWSKGE